MEELISSRSLTSPIKDSTVICLDSFNALLDARPKAISNAEDNLTRFRLWAGNIGAFQGLPSRASADFRLREAPEISSRILELLNEIQETNDELRASLTTGEDDKETPDDGFDPIEELCLAVSDSITSLMKVSALLRKATTRDRYAQALASEHDALPPEYASFDRRHVAEKFPRLQKKPWLCDRLADAMTMRRRYLRYAQRHQRRIALEPKAVATNPPMYVPSLATQSQAQRSSSLPKTTATALVSTAASTLQVQKLAEVDLDRLEIDDDDNVSQATSFISEADPADNNKSQVVDLDKLTKHREPFECPYCHGMVQFRNQRAWRKHVFRDLKAYVCTFPNCSAGLFEDRSSWFAHELECHRRTFLCLACSNKTFNEIESFQAHLRDVHPTQYLAASESVIHANSRPVAEIPVTACLMCDDWSPGLNIDSKQRDLTTVSLSIFKQHLASHQEQLALFAITPSFDREIDSEDGSQKSTGSKQDRSDELLNWQYTIGRDESTAGFDLSQSQLDGIHDRVDHAIEVINSKLDKVQHPDIVAQFQTLSEAYHSGEFDTSYFIDAGQALIQDLPDLLETFRHSLSERIDVSRVARADRFIEPSTPRKEHSGLLHNDNVETPEAPTHDRLLYGDANDLLFAAAIGDESTVEALLDAGVHTDAPWTRALGERRRHCSQCFKVTGYSGTQDALWGCETCDNFYLCHDCSLKGKYCTNNPNHAFQPVINARIGATALSVAAEHRHWKIARLLLEHGADIHGGKFSRNLLPNAIDDNEPEIATFLIENGANVNEFDTVSRQTPLNFAVIKGHKDIVDLLLDHGADVNASGTRPEETPLFLAIWRRHLSIAKRLAEKGASMDKPTLFRHLQSAYDDSRSSGSTSWDELADLLGVLPTRQKLFNSVVYETRATIADLERLRGSNKLCDSICDDMKRIADLVQSLHWNPKPDGNEGEQIFDDIEQTVAEFQASARNLFLWNHNQPSKLRLATRRSLQERVHDKDLLEIFEQTQKTISSLEASTTSLCLNVDLSWWCGRATTPPTVSHPSNNVSTILEKLRDPGRKTAGSDQSGAHPSLGINARSSELDEDIIASMMFDDLEHTEFIRASTEGEANWLTDPSMGRHTGLYTAALEMLENLAQGPSEDAPIRQLLSKALEQGRMATAYESDGRYAGAHEAYTKASSLLQSTASDMPDGSKKKKLMAIYSMYTARVEQLSQLIEELEDDDDNEAEYRCICGETDPATERTLISCDKCGVFQHCVCMGIPTAFKELPEFYLCERCAPEDHSETLKALERGFRIWESRSYLQEAEREVHPSQREMTPSDTPGTTYIDEERRTRSAVAEPDPSQSASMDTTHDKTEDWINESASRTFNSEIGLSQHKLEIHSSTNIQLTDCRYPGCHQCFSGRDKMLEHMHRDHKSSLPERESGHGESTIAAEEALELGLDVPVHVKSGYSKGADTESIPLRMRLAIHSFVAKNYPTGFPVVGFSPPEVWEKTKRYLVDEGHAEESILAFRSSLELYLHKVVWKQVSRNIDASGTIHRGILCDGPQCVDYDLSISGVRYKCTTCDDFDLCDRCIRDPKTSHPSDHDFLPLYVEDVHKSQPIQAAKKPGELRELGGNLRAGPALKDQSSDQNVARDGSSGFQWRCYYEPCASQNVVFQQESDMERHFEVTHARTTTQLIDCGVPQCHRKAENGFTRRDDLMEHMRLVHKVSEPASRNASSLTDSRSSPTPTGGDVNSDDNPSAQYHLQTPHLAAVP